MYLYIDSSKLSLSEQICRPVLNVITHESQCHKNWDENVHPALDTIITKTHSGHEDTLLCVCFSTVSVTSKQLRDGPVSDEPVSDWPGDGWISPK